MYVDIYYFLQPIICIVVDLMHCFQIGHEIYRGFSSHCVLLKLTEYLL